MSVTQVLPKKTIYGWALSTYRAKQKVILVDLVIITSYFAIMLFVGWSNRHQSAEGYWVAERRYSTARITMSLVPTIFGASSTIGIIGLGYSRGLTGAWWALIGGLALIPCAIFLASRIRSLNVYTLPDILKNAYGAKVSIPAGLMIAVAWCGVVAAQIIAAGRLVESIFSLDLDVALAIVAVIFILYTFWGGQLSVIKTDLWQLSLFIGGLLAVTVFLIWSLSFNSSLWVNIPQAHWNFPVSKNFGWYEVLVFYPFIVGFPYLVGPDIYSRIFCARDDKVARKAVLRGAMIVIPLSFVLAFVGILARAQFPDIPPESALPKTLAVLIPVGLKGLIVAGFLGAIMSSADTCLISASTILTLNVIEPFYSTEQEKHLTITKVIVILLGVIAWYIASRQAGIISSLILGYTVFVGGIVCPTLATFFQKKLGITSTAAVWAVIIGGSTAIIGKLQGGVLLKTILTDHGQVFLESILGPMYLSILPIILSAMCLLVISKIYRS